MSPYMKAAAAIDRLLRALRRKQRKRTQPTLYDPAERGPRHSAMTAPRPGQPPYKVGRQWPYENDRRAGKTHPDQVEMVDPLASLPRRVEHLDPNHHGGHQLRNPVPRWKRRADARRADKAAR